MHLEKGMAYYRQAEYDKARVELRNVLQIDPRSPQVYFVIGSIEEEQQNWQAAFGNYRKAAELDPSHVEAKVRLGRLYLLSGALQEAEDLVRDVLATRPDHPGARFLRAAALVRKGDVAAAIREATDVANADPTQTDAISLLGGLFTSQGDYARAQAILEKGVSANPKNIPLRMDLASVLVRRNALDKAEQLYQEVSGDRTEDAPLSSCAGHVLFADRKGRQGRENAEGRDPRRSRRRTASSLAGRFPGSQQEHEAGGRGVESGPAGQSERVPITLPSRAPVRGDGQEGAGRGDLSGDCPLRAAWARWPQGQGASGTPPARGR